MLSLQNQLNSLVRDEIKCLNFISFFRPSFERVNLLTENLIFHLEHGMALPADLQGDPVQFYKDLKAKVMSKTAHQERKDSDSDTSVSSKSSEDVSHERKGSKKGLRRKSSLGVISESSKKGEGLKLVPKENGEESSDINVNGDDKAGANNSVEDRIVNLVDNTEDTNNNEKDSHTVEADEKDSHTVEADVSCSIMDCSDAGNSLVPQINLHSQSQVPIETDVSVEEAEPNETDDLIGEVTTAKDGYTNKGMEIESEGETSVSQAENGDNDSAEIVAKMETVEKMEEN